MKTYKEGERELVEYENYKGRIKYTDAERFVEEEKDFTSKIPDEKKPEELKGKKELPEQVPEEVKEKVRGLKGYKKISESDKKDYLKQKIPDYKEK